MTDSTDSLRGVAIIGEINAVSLTLTAPVPLTEHPAAVYLSSLAPGSRPTMEQALNAIAKILTGNICDALTLDWAKLRYKHTAAVRVILMEKYAPATANKMLSALRRVLQETVRLELMDANDFARAVDIPCIKSSQELKGRCLSEAVLLILAKRGREVGITNFSAHDFRRTFISELLDSGVDIVTVQKLVGHATTDQTARYDRRGEETKRQAVQFISVPRRK